MPRQKSADQVETLRRQQAAITVKLKEAEAKAKRQAEEETSQRASIAGRVILAHMESLPHDPLSRSFLDLLAKSLTRKSERSLFPDLPASPTNASDAETSPDRSGEVTA